MKIKKEKPKEQTLASLKINTWSPWKCEPSTFNWEYFDDETCYILEGKAIIDSAKGERVEITKGDLVFLPKGLKCRWQVLEKVKKVYKLE
jgi:hypothetical protein